MLESGEPDGIPRHVFTLAAAHPVMQRRWDADEMIRGSFIHSTFYGALICEAEDIRVLGGRLEVDSS